MLTDTKLRNLKPKAKLYKAFDRDGMCVTVSPNASRLQGAAGPCRMRMAPTGLSRADWSSHGLCTGRADVAKTPMSKGCVPTN